MLSRYREKIYKCGDYLEVNLYPVFAPPGPKRKKRFKASTKTQERLNQKNAENKLSRLLNANFTGEDIKCELTYNLKNHPGSEEDAARELRNFLRRIKRYRKKKNLPELKYVSATEKGSRKGRYHHHIVMSGGLTPAEIAKIWGRGYVQKIQPLQFNECGIIGIAKYFPKIPESGERLFYKRWNASKNLVHPEPEIIDARLPRKIVKELAADTENRRLFEKYYKGYFLGQAEAVYNDVNGGVYMIIRLHSKEAAFYAGKRNRKRWT